MSKYCETVTGELYQDSTMRSYLAVVLIVLLACNYVRSEEWEENDDGPTDPTETPDDNSEPEPTDAPSAPENFVETQQESDKLSN